MSDAAVEYIIQEIHYLKDELSEYKMKHETDKTLINMLRSDKEALQAELDYVVKLLKQHKSNFDGGEYITLSDGVWKLYEPDVFNELSRLMEEYRHKCQD